MSVYTSVCTRKDASTEIYVVFSGDRISDVIIPTMCVVPMYFFNL